MYSVEQKGRRAVLMAVKNDVDFCTIPSYYADKGKQGKTSSIGAMAGESCCSCVSKPTVLAYRIFFSSII